jgi:hypothetical protein
MLHVQEVRPLHQWLPGEEEEEEEGVTNWDGF